jgi:endogenous inhibitor of DNA gyrase (YacG/DUF329 family)
MTDLPGPPLCVYCRRRPVEARFRPFCSERCRLLDLAAWADGTYRIAGDPLPPSEDDEPPTTLDR